jgi:hypothetical protein
MERNTLKICDIVTMSMEEMGGRSTYAGSVINLDAFIIDNHLGKTPLGGLVYGGEGLIEHGGRSILDTIGNAIRIIENRPRLNVIKIPINLDKVNLKNLILIPKGEQQWQGRWIKNPWGRHCWIDFIYAAVYSSLVLLDIDNSNIRTIGIDLSWNLGEGYFEPACDAILNFGNNDLKNKIKIIFLNLPGTLDDLSHNPLPSRYFFQKKYYQDGFNGIEFKNW